MTRDEWRRTAAILTQVGLLPEREREALIDSLGVTEVVRLQIRELLRQSATVVSGPVSGVPVAIASPSVPILNPGDSVETNRFIVVRQIGKGGMGSVYLAHDTLLGTLVALKVLVPDDRLITEAQRAAICSDHPRIVTVHNVLRTTFKGQPLGVIVMEHVNGTSASRLLDDGPVDPPRALRWIRDVADAVAHAHDRNILHCDLKPANIVITPDDRAMVLDFGIARATFDADNPEQPLRGTVEYMAPEQLFAGEFSPAGDIYSLGVTLFELLTGRRPFDGDATTLRMQILLAPSPNISDLRPDASPELDAIIGRALAKDPRERFRSARAFEHALQKVEAHDLSRRKPADRNRSRATAVAKGPSIAVLPFANLSPDQDTDYFSDGLTEELINALSHLSGLRVMSRTSAFEFKGKALDVRTIGRQLRVDNVLEGSVRKSGSRLRVTVQLVNVDDGCQLWATRFDRDLTDVFDIQDEIANTIARTLRVRLARSDGRPLVSRPTGDVEAYQLYLRGRFHWNKRSSDGFERAREFFRAALDRDAQFAPAHAGLADYYISVASWGLAGPDPAWSQAQQAALTALAIDSNLADAHVSLAAVRTYHEWNWAEGERELRRARELNPGDTNVLVQYATMLIQLGRFEEARAEMALALELDPLSATVNTYVAGVEYYARDYPRALEACRQGFELVPDDIELQCVLGLTYEAQGDYDRAIDAFQRARILSQDYPVVVAALAAVHAKAGQLEHAREMIERLHGIERERYVPPVAWAWIHVALGDFDRAFDELEKAALTHDVLACYVAVGPVYDSVRSDPRYTLLLRKIGLQPN